MTLVPMDGAETDVYVRRRRNDPYKARIGGI